MTKFNRNKMQLLVANRKITHKLIDLFAKRLSTYQTVHRKKFSSTFSLSFVGRQTLLLSNMNITVDDLNLEKFGRHVPRVLCGQVIEQLTELYLQKGTFTHESASNGDREAEVMDTNRSPRFLNNLHPSVQRFHGALLFVDISGFTVLSQRLNVDDLRMHINAYFKLILDIVLKYGGDVVKFAGDALFIVWQTPVSDLGKS